MSIRVAIHHITRYQFDRSVTIAPHLIRLRPAPHCRTHIESYSLRVQPAEHFINWQQDAFSNHVARLIFNEKARELSIEVDLIAKMTVINPFDFFLEKYADEIPFKYPETMLQGLDPYLKLEQSGPLLEEWVRPWRSVKDRSVDFLVRINQALSETIRYSLRMEPGVQTPEQTLEIKVGSCRDTAWLFTQILRSLGMAARFVSGYLVQLKADVEALDGPSGPQDDFTDLHAWTEVYVPGAGWIGLDPTSGLFAGEGHIPLACVPKPEDGAPVTGAVESCETHFSFQNSVQRLEETPRVTRPYRIEDWKRIDSLGDKVDEKLKELNLPLTMGGEPTFVGMDHPDAPEWNIDADGKEKRQLAQKLLLKLKDAFSKGGCLQYAQGKWYPGEQLPRWKYTCFWRKDEQPVWKDTKWLAPMDQSTGADIKAAKRFAEGLVENLNIHSDFIQPGYEDVFYYLWKKDQLPDNVDPLKVAKKDSSERRTLAKVLEQGLEDPVGFTIPLGWDPDENRWYSSKWTFRRDQMFLIPGDSPMGLRLPLNSIPWVTEKRRKPQPEKSPFEKDLPLGDFHQTSEDRRVSKIETAWQVGQEVDEVLDPIPHTAICLEPRDGRLYVFLPPVQLLEPFLDLIASIENAAARLDIPVVLEGYDPPFDNRLERLQVTPDPGVIEVNIHPSSSWRETVEKTERLYEEARQCRLIAEKFLLDGRHTGAGGGNHVTLGGATPATSPMLRRPDILGSLITYWQHHPGLSYLFSGMFIGPTSQAPRVDEGRDERLYELEIALANLPEGEVDNLWIGSRVLRNQLVDITGNTHRAEFCIDKLYPADSEGRRLGLLEFRGFEMPPHPQMSLAQSLLIRALVAKFAEKPYKEKLVRWGTALHDKFMLPHYVRRDLEEVTNDLADAGFDYSLDWLEPFFEFRFPTYGKVNIQDIEIELRLAIEPWHVLGEEISQSGTARYVDSSVERVQVKVSGLTDSRHMLVCNGHAIALRSTGVHGEYVAGIRFQAWNPPSAMHPTIGIHSPLVFDVIDTWNQRSIGGCVYRVSHPGGRSYDIAPVNSFEAEARRITRFADIGYTPGVIQPPPEIDAEMSFTPSLKSKKIRKIPARPSFNPEYPHTLDLRRND